MPPLIRNLTVLLTLVIVGIVATIVSTQQNPTSINPVTKQGIQNITVTNPNGELETISLGNEVILHFWATWCPPCVVELPELYQSAEQNKDISIIAIAVQDNAEKIADFMKKNDLDSDNVTIVMDPDWQLTKNSFQIKKLPASVFIHGNQVTKKVDGIVNWSEYIGFSSQ